MIYSNEYMRKQPGYTIIEAIIVIIILGILSAVTIPAVMKALSEFQAAGAAQKLANDLQYDKQTTKRTLQEYPATFDGTAGIYSIPLDDPMGPGKISGPANGCKSNWTGQLSFDIGGAPKTNGSVMTGDLAIVVTSQDGSVSKQVVVAAYSGNIGVQ